MVIPNKGPIFLCKLVKGSSYLSKLENKTPVICTQAYELACFFLILGSGPILDTLSF